MKSIEKALFDMRDAEYAAFQAKLTPSVPPELFYQQSCPGGSSLAPFENKNREHFCNRADSISFLSEIQLSEDTNRGCSTSLNISGKLCGIF